MRRELAGRLRARRRPRADGRRRRARVHQRASPTGAAAARASCVERAIRGSHARGRPLPRRRAGGLRARRLRRRDRRLPGRRVRAARATAGAGSGSSSCARSSTATPARGSVRWLLHTADAQGLYAQARLQPSAPPPLPADGTRPRRAAAARRSLRRAREPRATEHPDRRARASYEADPEQVAPRAAALLRRPGHERDAQVDPGLLRRRGRVPDRQPRPARRGLRGDRGQGAARWARSSATWSTRARSSRASTSRPAIRANALYGGGYPLFTALGRPLIAKLAVEHARSSGCDTIAHGCTGKGNDQVRIEATVATLAPELKVIAPVRSWQMGREEEIAYAREHGIPVKGGHRGGALLDRRQPLGALLGGPLDRGPRPRARGRRLPARHPARGRARRGRARRARVRARRAGRARTASAWSWSS